MYFAMNRFTVPIGNAQAFEEMWLGRESHLHGLDGFVAFHMLRGPEENGARLYISCSVWASEEAFGAWTRSPEFRAAHKNAGDGMVLHDGPPRFEGFTSIQHISAD